ncbi:MAG: HD-GYP domain-containing protein [Candidatus Firestonebacteria bacterium]|nr:HD-GYP domain-containing protein [Candidatus Firestonebacteria bacterium]
MKLISLKNASPGMKLARSIYNEKCDLLLAQGMELSIRYINRLMDLSVSMVYVEDERLNDVKPEELISNNIKNMTLQALTKTFNNFKDNSNNKNSNAIFNFNNINVDSLINQMLDELVHQNEVSIDLADIKTHDNYTFLHSLNVCLMSASLGILLEYNQLALFDLALGALLHDIGKILIPVNILNKPGKLSDEEFNVMKTHTKKGFDILKNNTPLKPISFCITLMHHERFDGSGYPQNLSDKQIHEFSRIVAIADVYDALTSDRPYRTRLMPEEAIKIMIKETGKYDPKFFEVFKKHIILYPVGSSVQLSTGDYAFVIGHHPMLPEKPIIRIVKPNDKKTEDVDLMEHNDISIIKILDQNI